MNERNKQAALEAFKVNYFENREAYDNFSTEDIWLRAWELATQAAYERAARECEQTPVSADMAMEARVQTKKDCAYNVRALANEK